MAEQKELALNLMQNNFDLPTDHFEYKSFSLGDNLDLGTEKRLIILQGQLRVLQNDLNKTLINLAEGDAFDLNIFSGKPFSLISSSDQLLIALGPNNLSSSKLTNCLEKTRQKIETKIIDLKKQDIKLKEQKNDLLNSKAEKFVPRILSFYGAEANIQLFDKQLNKIEELSEWLKTLNLQTTLKKLNSQELLELNFPFLLKDSNQQFHWIVDKNHHNLIEENLEGQRQILRPISEEIYQVLEIKHEKKISFSQTEEPYSMRWYLALFSENWLLASQMIFSSILIQVFALGMPFLYLVIFDRVFGRQNHSTLNVMAIGMIAILVFELIIKSLRSYVLAYQSELVDNISFQAFLDRVFRIPLSRLNRDIARSYQEAFNELSKNNQAIAYMVFISSLDAIFSSIVLTILLILNVPLTLISLAPIIPIVFLIIRNNSSLQRRAAAHNKEHALAQAKLTEALAGVETVKALNVNHLIRRNIFQQIEESFKKGFSLRLDRINEGSLMNWIIGLGSLATLYFGAHEVLGGKITYGVYMAINMMSKNVLSSFQKLATSSLKFYEALESSKKIKNLYFEKDEEASEGGVFLDRVKGKLQVANLTFRYQPDNPEVLKGLNFEIEAGQKIILLGKSGAGKTTLIRLLQRLYSPNEGYILLDDYNLADLNLYSLRQNIGVALQRPIIFAGNIKENIAIANPAAPMKEIVDAATSAQLNSILLKMPKGFDTPVATMGTNLSGGQTALICLARLFLLKPSILILDEALAALDPALNAAIFNEIFQIYKNKTCIFVTDYVPVHKKADKIIVLQDGQIVEQGSYSELMSSRGYYFNLYQNQI